MTRSRSVPFGLAVLLGLSACNALLGLDEDPRLFEQAGAAGHGTGAGGLGAGGAGTAGVANGGSGGEACADACVSCESEMVTPERAGPPLALAADGDYVYSADGGVRRIALANGSESMLIDGGAGYGLALDDGDLYAIGYSFDGVCDDFWCIAVVPQGEAPTMLVETGEYPGDFAVADGFAYWTAGEWAATGEPGGHLGRVPLAGGAEMDLASDLGEPRGLAVDGEHVYFTSSDGLLRRVPIAGGSPESLLTDLADPRDVAVDDEHIYWAELSGAALRRAPKRDPLAIETLVTDATEACELLLRGKHLFWAECASAGGAQVGHVALCDPPSTAIVYPDGNGNAALAADASHVYFGTRPSNAVFRAAY